MSIKLTFFITLLFITQSIPFFHYFGWSIDSEDSSDSPDSSDETNENMNTNTNGFLTKIPLSETLYPNAKCLDSSQAAYYLSLNNNKEDGLEYNNIWAIYLEGGGLCFSFDTCTNVPLGINFTSSTQFSPEIEGNQFYSRNCIDNPDFCNANLVYIPYCSQDTWNGRQLNGIPLNAQFPNQLFRFSGNFILESVITDLINNYGLNNAKMLLIGGVSAGGYGMWTNINRIQNRLPNTQVKGLSISGWIGPGNYLSNGTRNGFIYSDIFNFANGIDNMNQILDFASLFTLYNAFEIVSDCIAFFGGNILPNGQFCGSIDAYYPFINVPIFWTEHYIDYSHTAQFGGAFPYEFLNPPDITQNPAQLAYVNYYANNLLQSIRQINLNRDGIFVANCFDHVIGLTLGSLYGAPDNIVQGESVTSVFGDWFFDRIPNNPYQFIDDCTGFSCNPTCINQF